MPERADAQIEVDEPNNVDVRRNVDRAHTRPTALKGIIYMLSILQFVQKIVLTTKTVHRKNDVWHSLNAYRTLYPCYRSGAEKKTRRPNESVRNNMLRVVPALFWSASTAPPFLSFTNIYVSCVTYHDEPTNEPDSLLHYACQPQATRELHRFYRQSERSPEPYYLRVPRFRRTVTTATDVLL